MAENRGLGKGIRALIPESPSSKTEQPAKIALGQIRVNRFQPRKRMDESKIRELADSIRQSGLIYPLLVRRSNSGGVEAPYELIAGERRFRALQLLGESEAPVIIREMPDQKALELSLLENIQREGLNPIDEALAYQRLAQEFELTQESIAAAMGKDRATIANTLRLLKLAPEVRERVAEGALSLGHARALLAIESAQEQLALAKRAVSEGLSVRQVEYAARAAAEPRRGKARGSRDPHVVAAEDRLKRALGTNVQIQHGRSRGWIRIAYYSLKDLDRLLQKLA